MKEIQNTNILEAMRLLELIEMTNNAIERQSKRQETNEIEMDQYIDLKFQYASELNQVLEKFGYRIDLKQVA